MTGFLTRRKRTHYCGHLKASHAGEDVVLMGWVNRRRDHGGVIFIDLRDREGLVQVVFNPDVNPDCHAEAGRIRNEFVLAVHGRGIPLIGLDGEGRDDDWFTHHRLRDGVLFDGRG